MLLKDLKKDCLIQTTRTLSHCFFEDITNVPRSKLYSSRKCIEPNKILMFQEFIEHDETWGTIIKFIDIENCKYVYCWWDSRSVTYVLNCVTDKFDLLVE